MDERTHGHSAPRILLLLVLGIVGAMALVLLVSARAEAADCCSTSYPSKGKMVVEGTIPYRGELITVSIGGQSCLSKAGSGRAHIKATLETKYFPNGRYPIAIVQKVNGKIVTTTEHFRITDSPAVFVEVRRPQKKVVKTDSPTIRLRKKGDIRRTVCTLDGNKIRCRRREVELSGLSEGRHVFKVTVKGRDGYSWRDKKVLKVDTQAPTSPTVSGAEGWSNDFVEVRASGSTDSGTGIKRYEWRRSTDGGTTWGSVHRASNAYIDREGETVVAFRSVDRAGRESPWVEKTVRIDMTAPTGTPTVAVTSGDPCSGNYPVTLTASGADDPASGIDHYEFLIQMWDGSDYVEWTENADSITLDQPGEYNLYVSAVDAAGNLGWEGASWSSTDCI